MKPYYFNHREDQIIKEAVAQSKTVKEGCETASRRIKEELSKTRTHCSVLRRWGIISKLDKEYNNNVRHVSITPVTEPELKCSDNVSFLDELVAVLNSEQKKKLVLKLLSQVL